MKIKIIVNSQEFSTNNVKLAKKFLTMLTDDQPSLNNDDHQQEGRQKTKRPRWTNYDLNIVKNNLEVPPRKINLLLKTPRKSQSISTIKGKIKNGLINVYEKI